jgi:hypothetical protein
MIRFLKETWLATSVFGGLSLLVATADLPMIHYAPPITALIVVPFVWKNWVMRQGRPRMERAAFAGAISTFMIWFGSSYMTYGLLQLVHPRPRIPGWEGLGSFLLLATEFIGGLLGAGIGLVVAFAQARVWPVEPQAPMENEGIWDGAVGGALVSTGVAPYAALVLSSVLSAIGVRGGDIAAYTAATWLVLIPAGSFLGAKAVRQGWQ